MNILLFIIQIPIYIYMYCTDYIISLANIFNSSYYEINFYIFIIIYPLLLILTFSIFIIQKIRLYNNK